MKPITETVIVTLTAEEVVEINGLIKRNKAKLGIPHEDYSNLNRCPLCRNTFGASDSFCSKCGQRLEFNASDDIPL